MWPFIIDLIVGRGIMLRLVTLSLLVLAWLTLRPEQLDRPVIDTVPESQPNEVK